MKNILLKVKKNNYFRALNKKGFVIPFTLIVTTIILTVSLGVSLILVKEVYFSKLNRDSLFAYYAADEALECAIYVDNKYTTESDHGLFPHTSTSDTGTALTNYNARYSPSVSLNNITCDTANIFDTSLSNYAVNCAVNNSCVTTYDVKMKLSDTEDRCAKVTVTKSLNTTTKYVATGYSSCRTYGRVERTVSK